MMIRQSAGWKNISKWEKAIKIDLTIYVSVSRFCDEDILTKFSISTRQNTFFREKSDFESESEA